MSLINCPECGTEVSDKANACPKCAFPFKIAETITKPAIVEGVKSLPPRINRAWGHISWITYLSIGLLFLLPFCDLNCSGRKIGSLSGVVLVTGATLSPTVLGTEIGESRDIPANLWAVLAFLSTLLGLLVSLSYFRSNILSGILGLACAFFLIILQVSINEKMNEAQFSLFTASFTVPYWIALISAVVIGIINFSTTQSHFSQNELITLGIKTVIVIVIYSFVISGFDSTSPFLFRPTLNSLNSESSLFSFGPSEKEKEERRIADSIRVADSIAMVQAEQQRISDSIVAVQSDRRTIDSVLAFHFSKSFSSYSIFTPNGEVDVEGDQKGSWSTSVKVITRIEFAIKENDEIILHNNDGSITEFHSLSDFSYETALDGTMYLNFFGFSKSNKKKHFFYRTTGNLCITDDSDQSAIQFLP